jgi:hypothetical protein
LHHDGQGPYVLRWRGGEPRPEKAEPL